MSQGPGDVLEGAEQVAHWGWVYDYDDDGGGGFASGEFLLRSDGVLLRRSVFSRYRDGETTWRAHPWQPVSWWEGQTDAAEAMNLLKAHGYGLCRPDVPFDQDGAGPYPGLPPLAEFL
jgi:hypothetical protein